MTLVARTGRCQVDLDQAVGTRVPGHFGCGRRRDHGAPGVVVGTGWTAGAVDRAAGGKVDPEAAILLDEVALHRGVGTGVGGGSPDEYTRAPVRIDGVAGARAGSPDRVARGGVTDEYAGAVVPERGRPAYTTIQTTVYRLEGKKALQRVKKISNAHIFEAAISRKGALGRMIDELLSVFGSKPVMAHMVKTGQLTLEDIKEAEQELRKLARREKEESK